MLYSDETFTCPFSAGSRPAIRIAAVLLGMQLLLQCSPPQILPVMNGTAAEASSPAAVTIASGDAIDVKFYYTPEMNESQTVRPDGKISLQLLGDVAASGKTPEQLRKELITLYTPHLKNPEIVVILREMNERRVYVGGEVNRPGSVRIPGSLTVLEAIMDAGGFNHASARLRHVVIIRRNGNAWNGFEIDLSKPLRGGTVALCELQPRDIIYVPQKPIVAIDQWVDQYINKVIPDFVPAAAGNYYLGQWIMGHVK